MNSIGNFASVPDIAQAEQRIMLGIGIAIVGLVVLALVTAARQHRKKAVGMRQRARWGDLGYAEARTAMLTALSALSNRQLHDVKRRDVALAAGLGAHFDSVFTLAQRAGFVEQHQFRAGWRRCVLAVLLRDTALAREWYIRFSEAGLQTFTAAQDRGRLSVRFWAPE